MDLQLQPRRQFRAGIERLFDYGPAISGLTGMESISGHTLSDFRVDHADALRDLFAQLPGEPR